MNKKLIISIIVVVLAVVAWWVVSQQQASAPVAPVAENDDFSTQLSGLDSVDLQADLNSIDADINQL